MSGKSRKAGCCFMKNESLVKSWLDFAEMDANLALFTFENMHPKPLELICYHCQQAAEKNLKALMISLSENTAAPKTHDLALLADSLCGTFEIDDSVYNACSDLTPYGVKVRYPKEIPVDEPMTKKALADMKKVTDWARSKLNYD